MYLADDQQHLSLRLGIGISTVIHLHHEMSLCTWKLREFNLRGETTLSPLKEYQITLLEVLWRVLGRVEIAECFTPG